MGIDDISVWGALLLALLMGLTLALIGLIDRRMLGRVLAVPKWRKPQLPTRLLLSAVAAVIGTSFAMAGLLMLSLPCRLFWPLLVVLVLLQVLAVGASLTTYWRSVLRTKAHRRYLLANGATHLESLIPSVRRALRAAMLALSWHRPKTIPLAFLMLFCGLLMCGTSIAAALVVVVLTWVAAWVAAMVSTIVAVWTFNVQWPPRRRGVDG